MREKNLINYISKAIKDEHLYSEEELIYMKRELTNLKEQLSLNKKLTSKGFGN